MNNLEAYIREAESHGAKHCVVPVKNFRALMEAAEAARVFADCYIVKEPDDHETKALLSALAKLDEVRRG